ncbi:redoxin domain-containing protein [Porifericola rhodea]|uniref:redoxin domain-containing protein n=1 Tax=Porifericola rhodea TaxID=930972 RepID=UPI00266709E2|nr:redoxin domain-containing protein [Porifericola rhodea]WKN30397.1 redoxin domain-containing protein [Porifericola rhodea]
MNIEVNATAPLFELTDMYGREIKLATYKGKKVFLGFFRHAGCPFCNLRVHALTKVHQELKAKGMEMIFFFESKESVLQRSSFHQEVSPIPLISDPQKIWYDTYGLETSGLKSSIGHITSFAKTAIQAKLKGLPLHTMADGESISTMPAEFLLDENLIIRKLYYSQRLSDRFAMEDIFSFAEQSKSQVAIH